MSSSPLNVGVIFGGESPEHEVSVITGLQAIEHFDRSAFNPIPIYISKSGHWYTGDVLLDISEFRNLENVTRKAERAHLERAEQRGALLISGIAGFFKKPSSVPLDVLFIALHGGPGESGAIQGLCESMGLPFTGSGLLGSSVGMDKVISKMLCRQQDLPVVDWLAFRESEWIDHEDDWLDRIEHDLGYPCVVKPSRLGSSIGISVVTDRQKLDRGIEEALRYDEKIIVEHAVPNLREINCSVLGDANFAEASVLEEPVRSGDETLLSFTDKYQRGSGKSAKGTQQQSPGMASLDRLIPAPLTNEEAQKIREIGVRVFQLFECAGVARIDFLLNSKTGEIYFNEINTIPGSFSFYLWDPAGVPFGTLIGRLIEGALERFKKEHGRIRSYDTNLLENFSSTGAKGVKTSS